MSIRFWQVEILKKSIKKKEKLKILENNLKIAPQSLVLDLGCAQGILSFFLRKKGGFWVSVDQDFLNLKTSKNLLEKNLIQIGPGSLPFQNRVFNLVLCLDYLEHLEDDLFCLKEINRVLKEEGILILATPRRGKKMLLNRVRPLLGLKIENYGHKKEGYTLKELEEKLRNTHFSIEKKTTFARFFSEAIELVLNFFYIKLFSKPEAPTLRDGHIRPSSKEEFASVEKVFRLYSFVYPLLWMISRLDKLLFFQKGYGILIWARKSGP